MNYYNKKGYRTGFYQLRGHIEDDRDHYIKRIKPIFKLLYDIDISLRDMPSTRVFGFQIWSNKLTKFKESLGLPLGKKFDIEIPELFFKNENSKTAIIRGIFDTDGGIYLEKKNNKLYPIVYIVTISENLNNQLLDLLNQLNIRATSYNWLTEIGNRKRAYRISIRGVEMFDKFMEIIRPANQKHIDKYVLFKETFK
jgi:DNA-binding transcriptional regulator WhiA